MDESDVELSLAACSCPPGTEGTRACNFGRLCGRLRADGRDVGDILIAEGLAEPYTCRGPHHCGGRSINVRETLCCRPKNFPLREVTMQK